MIETSPEYSVAIIGNGWVGGAYNKMFPEAVMYDEPQIIEAAENPIQARQKITLGRKAVNACDLALIAVPTNLNEDNELDMSIVEDVVGWVDTPLILIKSALQPGTVDRLVEETGKNIAVSVEMVGEGKYFIPFWKYPHPEDPTPHSFLIVGGEDEIARRAADFLWRKMSPDIDIHLTTAIEAEICKMMENTWGALKVTYANTIYDICEQYGANFTRVLQAWGADGRTEKMHMRVVPHRRGWTSKCWDKDVPALAKIDKSGFLKGLVEVNEVHKERN